MKKWVVSLEEWKGYSFDIVNEKRLSGSEIVYQRKHLKIRRDFSCS